VLPVELVGLGVELAERMTPPTPSETPLPVARSTDWGGVQAASGTASAKTARRSHVSADARRAADMGHRVATFVAMSSVTLHTEDIGIYDCPALSAGSWR
jgi:hypothetical protein